MKSPSFFWDEISFWCTRMKLPCLFFLDENSVRFCQILKIYLQNMHDDIIHFSLENLRKYSDYLLKIFNLDHTALFLCEISKYGRDKILYYDLKANYLEINLV